MSVRLISDSLLNMTADLLVLRCVFYSLRFFLNWLHFFMNPCKIRMENQKKLSCEIQPSSEFIVKLIIRYSIRMHDSRSKYS